MSEKTNSANVNRIFAHNLKTLRKSAGVTQLELGDMLGVKKSCISNYEQGLSMPDAAKLIEIANFFGVENIGSLLGYSLSGNTLRESDQLNRTVPIVDYVEFGANPTSKNRIIDEMELPTVNLKTGDFFGIIVEDNSMSRSDIKRGDIAIIRRQDFASTGDIALVVRPGEPALLRRVFVLNNDTISLQPDSTDVGFLPVILRNEGEDYEVLGRLTYKISSF